MDRTSRSILVVEDIPAVRELLEVTLRYRGYSVLTARNGQEALALIPEQQPALVITDILMPKLDGFALAYKIRSQPETRQLPIVFLSATYITPEDREFALRLGAVRFLEKPVDTEELLITVAEILTKGISTLPRPMDRAAFFLGYKERLEDKLRHKNAQIARAERLLGDLNADQKQAFEDLLMEAQTHREQIQRELDLLYEHLREIEEEEAP